MQMLKQGDQGEEVKLWQTYLGAPIVVDGIFGPKTHAATVAFQRANDLEPDGIVDIDTWDAATEAGRGYDQSNNQKTSSGEGSLFGKLMGGVLAGTLGLAGILGAKALVKRL